MVCGSATSISSFLCQPLVTHFTVLRDYPWYGRTLLQALLFKHLAIRLRTLSMNAFPSSVRLCMAHSRETYLGLVVLLLPHGYKLKADCRIFHIHSQQQWLPYGGGRILRKIRRQDAEYASILVPLNRKAAGRLGLTGLYFAI